MTDKGWRVLRMLGAAALIAITLYLVDPQLVFDRLRGLRLSWVLVGLGLSLPLHVVLALRWQHIARSIAAPLSFRSALRGYYLAGFVNQALPTGLAGAALRAMLHSRQLRSDNSPIGMAHAASAVILDRLAGLAALCLFALIGSALLGATHPLAGLLGAASVVAMLAMGTAGLWLAGRHGGFGELLSAGVKAVFGPGRCFWVQSALSILVVLLLSSTFFCAARASGVELSFHRTILMAPVVLGAMAIPLAIAGWGLREAAAAALFAALGMAPASGVAVSIAFGAMTLVASGPGLVLWLSPQARAQKSVVDTGQDPA